MGQRLTDQYVPLNQGRTKKENALPKFKTRDTITGTRKVQVNKNTWIYTKFATDEEAIENFNKLHGL